MPAWREPKERIRSLIMFDPNSGCWLWAGCVDRCGYGKFNFGKESAAHRASYMLFTGPIPEGNEIDHKCKIRSCVNPAHLEAVTHSENVARGDYKSNHRNGRKTHCIKGHEFTPNNTISETWLGRNRRRCKQCRKESLALYPDVKFVEIDA